jgi:hypothetical protein
LRSEIEKIVQSRVSGAYSLALAMRGALTNVAYVDNGPTVHTPGQSTITAFAGMLLTARSSGRFFCSMIAQYAIPASSTVTLTVTTYTQTTPGSPIVLPSTNAQSVGLNCYVDNSGAGIAPTSGGTAHPVTAPAITNTATAASNVVLSYSGLCQGAGGSPVPQGLQFYVTFSVSGGAGAITQLAMSAFELP